MLCGEEGWAERGGRGKVGRSRDQFGAELGKRMEDAYTLSGRTIGLDTLRSSDQCSMVLLRADEGGCQS